MYLLTLKKSWLLGQLMMGWLGTIQILRNQKGGWVWPNAYVCLQGGWVLANTYVMNCWNHQKRISF